MSSALRTTVCFVRILNGAGVLQYVSVPRGDIPGQYQQRSGRGQKRARLDVAQKWPSCVRLSTRKGSLLRGGPGGGPRGATRETREGVHEEVQDEVEEKDVVEKTTPKSNKM